MVRFVKRLKDWFQYRWFLNSLMYCSCCYGRQMAYERSWALQVTPRPLPIFDVEECDAGWRVWLGWFMLRITRAGYGYCFQRRHVSSESRTKM
jgi:hypothetical protein